MAQNIMTLPQKRNAMNCFFSFHYYYIYYVLPKMMYVMVTVNLNPNTAGPNLGEYVDAILIQTKICMRVYIYIYIYIYIQTFKQSILYSEFIYIVHIYVNIQRESIIYFNLYIVLIVV